MAPAAAGHAHHQPHDRPAYHLAPDRGWVNDPNGPLFYRGYYHLFYQHVPEGCVWSFGLYWGHSVSRDLVRWEHLPPALVPTPGGLDQDGCFSGCAVLRDDGTPMLMYTGVRLRSSPTCGPLPPSECDLHLPFIESQCAAYPADPDDPKLINWVKSEVPWLALPPPSMNLGGWRDPYIIGQPGVDGHDRWSLILGSGVKQDGGTVLVYTSKELEHGWQYWGELCHGRGRAAETGIIWECPLLFAPAPVPERHTLIRGFPHQHPEPHHGSHTPLLQAATAVGNGTAGSNGHSHAGAVPGPGQHQPNAQQHLPPTSPPAQQQRMPRVFCMSPDAPVNPSYYWIGDYDPATHKFDLEGAAGPFRLDIGDILYAPNTLLDPKTGRLLLWGWLQERRKVGVYDYAGCMTLPRVMWLERSAPPPLAGAAAHGNGNGNGAPAEAKAPAASAGPGHGWHLYQQPLPDLRRLRSLAGGWRLRDEEGVGPEGFLLASCGRYTIPRVSGPLLELELVLQQGEGGEDGPSSQCSRLRPDHPYAEAAMGGAESEANGGSATSEEEDALAEASSSSAAAPPRVSASGVLLHSWQSGAEGNAALLYHWGTGVLEVVFEAVQPDRMAFSLSAPGARRVGGRLLRPPAPGTPLSLRLFLDYSVLEVYTGGGEVLTTRLYRGHPPVPEAHAPEPGAGLEIISAGSSTRVLHAAAYEMRPAVGPATGATPPDSVLATGANTPAALGSPRLSESLLLASPFNLSLAKPSLSPLPDDSGLLLNGTSNLPPGHSLVGSPLPSDINYDQLTSLLASGGGSMHFTPAYPTTAASPLTCLDRVAQHLAGSSLAGRRLDGSVDDDGAGGGVDTSGSSPADGLGSTFGGRRRLALGQIDE